MADSAEGTEKSPKRGLEDKEEDTKSPKKARTGTKKKAEKKKKEEPEGYQLNINKCVDKAHEGKSFNEIIKLPPSALQGLSEKADAMLSEFHIKTIADLAGWKYFKIARAIVDLEKFEEKGKRQKDSKLNLNNALDKAWEQKSLKDITKAPISAFQGLAKWADDVLKSVKSIKDLAKWKYAVWADALVVLAAYENPDFSSR